MTDSSETYKIPEKHKKTGKIKQFLPNFARRWLG